MMRVLLALTAATTAGLGWMSPAVSEEAAPEEAAPEAKIKPSGAVRFTYLLTSWENSGSDSERERERGGDIIFDTLQLGLDGSYGDLSVSGGYRFYSGYSMLHHGYIGYAASDNVQVDVGLHQVPFGILPFASHNWFFDINYYIGLEDDYDTGIRTSIKLGDLDLRFGFYKNSEGTYTGSSVDSARYSYDVVRTTVGELGYGGATEDVNNIETNQVNARVGYNVKLSPEIHGELGVSAQLGGIYNLDTEKYGYHWAAAAHLNGHLGPLNLHLQGLAYRYELENPAGTRDDVVVMGAYDAPYFVAAAAYTFIVNLQYPLPFDISLGNVDVNLSVHENFSVMLKDDSDWETTMQNSLGMLFAAGPIYMYADLVQGRHHPWLGPGGGYGAALAEGRFNDDGTPDDSWHTRFNVNLGYYF